MLEFVTLRSEFCDTYFCVCDTHFRDLGGRKLIPESARLMTSGRGPAAVRFFFRGGFCDIGIHLFSVISLIACTSPNRSGVGAIDNSDHFEHAFDPCYNPEVPEIFFTHDVSMVRRQKILIFGVF